ncbi:MAG: transglycosylase domain-containing protein [Dysgonamonadaceae bacterium]|jgi:penicillin-binding protein 1A|nr:transglycosylase domain-containing protein [Dysgonamonadaceae bacterium]
MAKKKSNYSAKKIIKWFWISFAGLLAFTFLFFLMIAYGWIGYMPDIEELKNPIDKYATQLVSVDNQIMGTYSRSKGNRIYVDYQDLPPSIVNALVATEDARFHDHAGIDAYALVRAVVKKVFMGKTSGGSTITQQLAKQVYSNRDDRKATNVIERLFQKPIEWVIAVQLERYYTKEEIIDMYLKQFDFLYNAVGIKTACWVYFGKPPKDIKTEEAATLIGMCQNPRKYNPVPEKKRERTRGRRNVVLDLMCENHYLTRAECDSLKALPMVINFHKVDHNEGVAPYLREYLRTTLTAGKPRKSDYPDWNKYQYTKDSLAWINNPLYGWCNKNKKADGSTYDLYIDGLKIYTTIDSRMQHYAEQAVAEHLGGILQPAFFREKAKSATAPYSRNLSKKDLEKILDRAMKQTERYRLLKKDGASDKEIQEAFGTPVDMQIFSWQGPKDTILTPMDSIRYMKSILRTGFMVMEPQSGAVKAYVGGIDFKYFQYDMVTMGRRQVGSTIKPFLYSLAMESGLTPCNEMMHVAQTLYDDLGRDWTPNNTVKSREGEMVSLRWGLQQSDNWVSAYLMKELSPRAFKRKLIEAYGFSEPIDAVPSLCLGPCEVSIAEMVSGYSAFSTGGMRVEPMYITRIEDKNGNIIASFSPQMHQVITEDAAYKMLSMLRSVMDGGTGGGMRGRQGVTAPMGGKTGTTQNNSDCWFMGFTPTLVGGCWVGGDDRDIHFTSMNEGQGARAALPVMGIFLKKVFADASLGYSPTQSFSVPEKYGNPCSNYEETQQGELNLSPAALDDLFD